MILLALAQGFVAPSHSLARSVRRASEDEVQETFIALETPANEAPEVLATEEDDNVKKTRVLVYMGLSLLPILALIPFMSSRDFLPADPSVFT